MNLQTRLSEEKRTELGKKLPLYQPYVLLVDPSSICNLRCKWCPGGYDKLIENTRGENSIMDLKLFRQVIDQAREFDMPFRTLRLYKEGEPLVNPNFDKMIKLACASNLFLRIDTTTNGLLLNKELNRKIIDAGINQINISVNGVSEEQIFQNTKRRIDYKKYVENIRDLCKNSGDCVIYVKSIQDILTDQQQKEFLDTFGEFADRVYLERLSPAWPDFDVSQSGYQYEDVGNYGQRIEDRKVCPYLFYIMVINADGTVSTCVGDWKHEQIIGNICESSIKQIWLGKTLHQYQIKHLEGHRFDFPMCKKCKVISHGCYDNIDDYATRIKEKLEECM